MSDVPSNIVMYSGIIGFFLPVLMAVIIQTGWSDRAKAVAAFLASLVAGAGTSYFSGNFDGRDVVTCALITLTVGISTYYGFWKPTGMAPALQNATTVKGAAPVVAAPRPTPIVASAPVKKVASKKVDK